MKNISLILNGILIIAVGVLYFLHFSGKKSGSESTVSAPSDLKIAYIKSDSVLKHYDYFKEMRTVLEAKGKNWIRICKTAVKATKRNHFLSTQY